MFCDYFFFVTNKHWLLNETSEFPLQICEVLFAAFAKFAEKKPRLSFVMSVRPPAWNNTAPTGRIFTKFGILVFFFRKFVEKIQFP